MIKEAVISHFLKKSGIEQSQKIKRPKKNYYDVTCYGQPTYIADNPGAFHNEGLSLNPFFSWLSWWGKATR